VSATDNPPPTPCPVCGKPAEVKAYGPFFCDGGTPTFRFALSCPVYCWRGRMAATREEAKAAGGAK